MSETTTTTETQPPTTPLAPVDAGHQQLLANAPTIVYAPSGLGKSTLLATLADYVWERSGELYGTRNRKILRYVAVDSGGFPQRIASLARLGVVEIWRCRNHVAAASVCDQFVKGWWPTTIDTRTGMAPEDVKLAPPVLTRYDQWCATCQRVLRSAYGGGFTAMQCGTCKGMVSDRSVRMVTAPNPSFAHVGGVAIDGLTSMQDWILEEIERATAAGKLGGEKAAIGGVFESGDTKYAGNSRAHVGFGQLRAQLWCSYAATVPGLIVPVHFTALEDQGSDDRSSPIYGPKIAGQARTYQVPAWVGHCLYLRKVGDERRIYLQNVGFSEEGNVQHLAKTRTDPGTMPAYLSDVDAATGQPLPTFTRFSLAYFYREVDRIAGDVDQAMAAKFGDVAGSIQRAEIDLGQLQQAAAGATAAQPVSSHPAVPAGASTTTSLPAAAPRRGGRRTTPPPPVVPSLVGTSPAESAPSPSDSPAEPEPVSPETRALVERAEDVLTQIAQARAQQASVSNTPAVQAAAPPMAAPAAPVPAAPVPASTLPTAAPRRPRGLPTASAGPRAGGYTPHGAVVETTPPPPTARPTERPPSV